MNKNQIEDKINLLRNKDVEFFSNSEFKNKFNCNFDTAKDLLKTNQFPIEIHIFGGNNIEVQFKKLSEILINNRSAVIQFSFDLDNEQIMFRLFTLNSEELENFLHKHNN